MDAFGEMKWIISGGYIPLHSNGHEPEFTSRDQIAILNTGDEPVELKMHIMYSDQDPVGPYKLRVGSRRVRKVRFNDLIDPFAMSLDTAFGAVIESDHPVIIQFSRVDTSSDKIAILGTMAFSEG